MPLHPPATCTNNPNRPIIMKEVIQGQELWIHKVEGGEVYIHVHVLEIRIPKEGLYDRAINRRLLIKLEEFQLRYKRFRYLIQMWNLKGELLEGGLKRG